MGFRRHAVTGGAALAAALLVLVGGCAGGGSEAVHAQAPGPHPASPGRPSGAVTAPSRGTTPAARVAAIVRSMSLPEKVGQLLVPTVPGRTAAAGGAALVREYHVGGVIYFGPNIGSAAQVGALSSGLQRAALGQPPGIPLLIGTDQEGGIVSRLAGVTTLFPNQMAGGATRDQALVRAQEQVTGTQLRALGINLDYAPDADVNVDPVNPVIGIRSFGARADLVSAMTSAAVAGFHAAGEAATAKHFPGHGDTDTDSHTGLAIIHHSLSQWWRIDAPPFEAAIKAGVDEIMIGHIEVPALDDSGQPASLSHKIVTGLLRDRLGYHGVVTTDSLQMGGVLAGHNDAQIATAAIQAGCDQLLMPGNVPVAYHAVLAAVRAGRISMARLNASVTRIITLKMARGLFARPSARAPGTSLAVNTPAQRAVAQQLADRSVTLVRNRSVTVPAGGKAGPVLPLAPGQDVYVTGPAGPGLAGPLRAALRGGGQVTADPAAARVIVVATQDATDDSGQQQLVASLAATGKPVIVVATGVPYDLGLFPRSAAGIATYSDTAASMTAAAAVLAGQLRPAGRLPVSIPGASGGTAYRYGTGLH